MDESLSTTLGLGPALPRFPVPVPSTQHQVLASSIRLCAAYRHGHHSNLTVVSMLQFLAMAVPESVLKKRRTFEAIKAKREEEAVAAKKVSILNTLMMCLVASGAESLPL